MSRMSTLAPWAMRALATEVWPVAEDIISAVSLKVSMRLGSTPLARSNSTMSFLPYIDAL